MQGGIFGWLRQEFRELSYLDKITELRFEEKLSSGIIHPMRWTTIDAFRKWRGKGNDEKEWHPILQAEPGVEEFTRPSRVSTWRASTHKMMRGKPSASKRGADSVHGEQPSKKRKLEGGVGQIVDDRGNPVGPVWDGADHSCAFNSWVFLLSALYFYDVERWASSLARLSPSFDLLHRGLRDNVDRELEDHGLTSLRNDWRSMVRRDRPQEYPGGSAGVDICTLTQTLFGRNMVESEAIHGPTGRFEFNPGGVRPPDQCVWTVC
ncbi:hypothetical protein BKA70DRAFT_1541416 [Coprinopsis sp. MPI-PUGE-AT-0042]|nr:hypothetical protein BKA70DRAFT_1541416 [Coprinopsis sp. MPI-PUGE-AT-0042]